MKKYNVTIKWWDGNWRWDGSRCLDSYGSVKISTNRPSYLYKKMDEYNLKHSGVPFYFNTITGEEIEDETWLLIDHDYREEKGWW